MKQIYYQYCSAIALQLIMAVSCFGVASGLPLFRQNQSKAGEPTTFTGNGKAKIWAEDSIHSTATYRDIFPDTWVATDGIGRSMPDDAAVGPVKLDQRRVVGIFYICWHTQDHHTNFKSPYAADVTRILTAAPEARLDAKHPLWQESSYHWGEPEMGYFLSQDEYVIRKDMSMLSDAGVDVLVMDVTNAVRYWEEWDVTFRTMQKMKAEGNKVPKFIFWAFNGPVITVVQDLYDRIYKQQRFKDLWFEWDDALAANPEFLYINDWNEWTAGKYQPKEGQTTAWLGRNNSFFFVDQYNAEFNRCIHPMKNGYTDNYYMQMAQNIRKYKGIRSIPELKGFSKIKMDGQFEDWKTISTEYRDTKGDVVHRASKGYGGLYYTNNSGRNDIITAKVAVKPKDICFYAEATNKLTASSDSNWMLLLIDADHNPATGWFGYDFIVNKKVKDAKTTTLMRYDGNQKEQHWVEVAELAYRQNGNQLELQIPRKWMGLADREFVFDFKWSDNASDLTDPISLCLNGDTAPNRRFNYRCIWKK